MLLEFVSPARRPSATCLGGDQRVMVNQLKSINQSIQAVTEKHYLDHEFAELTSQDSDSNRSQNNINQCLLLKNWISYSSSQRDICTGVKNGILSSRIRYLLLSLVNSYCHMCGLLSCIVVL